MAHTIRTEVHGHRGSRGNFPANTLPAFLHATRAGCHWLEMDVVATADNEVLVSHEPWMDHRTCLSPEGQPLSEAEGRAANIHRMPLAHVQQYRVKGPGPGTANKPTLAEVVQAVRRQAAAAGKQAPRFNIEVKSELAWYGTYQPRPGVLVELVHREIAALGIAGHCLVQSFDPAILEEMHRAAPSIPLALLVENKGGVKSELERLSFKPAYCSPAFQLVDAALVDALHNQGIKLLTWTVNEEADMRRMLHLGVDGLITDEPAMALALIRSTASPSGR